MPRELTLHPETGQLVEVVHSYQTLELGTLQEDVNAREQALAEVRSRREAKQAELQALSQEEGAAEASLEDSKSALTRGHELVGQPASDVDSGADGTSSEVPAPVEGPNF